jgi:putative endopeptidase
MSYQAYLRYAQAHNNTPDLDAFFRSYARMWRTNTSEATARNYLRVDPHSPAKSRVNTILSLFQPFHDYYGVAPGDAMSSTPRLVIW